jgi:hypothetical protein
MANKSLAKKADSLFSEVIRKRGSCERCGSKDYLACHHIISRSYHKVRYNLTNGSLLCRGCHFFVTNHPLEAEEFYTDKLGKETMKSLRIHALQYDKKLDYEEICERLKGEL